MKRTLDDSGLSRPTKRAKSANSESDYDSDDSATNSEALSDVQPPSPPTTSRITLEGLSRFRTPQAAQTTPPIPSKQPRQSSFTGLGIAPSLQAALKSMSIRTPTEVQAECIPPLLAGRDCIGNAKTGSGKTIAFALPILQKLSVDPYGIFALVLTPTRELAFQISDQFAALGAPLNIRTAVVVGGMDMMAQSIELGNRPHVVVATPGRLVDHLNSSSGEWDLSRVKFLVLDEADRLLTPTFAPELGHLFSVLPKSRQTCLFTATITDSIENVAAAEPPPGKLKPFFHRMQEQVETVSTLRQLYTLVPSHVRETYLFHLLCNPPEETVSMRRAPPESTKKTRKGQSNRKERKQKVDQTPEDIEQPPPTMIFCNRPRTAAYLTLVLKTLGIRSTALHSRLTQRERLTSLSLFRSSVVPVLIATDVGSRGLDIDDVAIVVNWDLPQEPEEYTHRVGRTARAGKRGVAVSFVTERDEDRLLQIEARIGTKLDETTMPEGKVLEKLNAVSTAKRLANMELHDTNFGKRETVHKAKQVQS
ncbi:DEAD-domain-containing protein [Cylindrobasidium torrendii FP15055 ss-10]|uniref:DEAD-domain-containing protein n=1 Tax=Cylindrobasidium torrendii FP15055 ss-10 TaxID=1314674 RepID=A0A0D7BTK0_9AGAR|nr:DEAD-domain-containing protein [Cylindrobasidium torrendii FP15055 ss-10]